MSRNFLSRNFCWALLLGATTTFSLGCDGGKEFKPVDQLPQHADDHGHGHGAEGPHHGALVKLGENEYQAEVVVDDKSHTLTVYLLAADGKTPVTTAATELTITPEEEAQLTLKPAADQPEGQHSVFQLTDEKAVHELAEAGFLHGNLTVKIGEKAYTTFVDAHFHGDHDHDAHPEGEKMTAPAADPAPADAPAENTPAAAPETKTE